MGSLLQRCMWNGTGDPEKREGLSAKYLDPKPPRREQFPKSCDRKAQQITLELSLHHHSILLEPNGQWNGQLQSGHSVAVKSFAT